MHLVVDGFSVGHLVRKDGRGVREKAGGNCRRIQNLSVAISFVRQMYRVYALNAQHQLSMRLRMQHFFSPGSLTINLSGVFFKWVLCGIIRISKCPPSFTVLSCSYPSW